MKFLNLFDSSAPTLTWQRLKSKNKFVPNLYRSAVPGGWIVSNHSGNALVFIPDDKHQWDGDSYPIYDTKR